MIAFVRELPDGTVTFLFSDVEGSTQLLERHGPALGTALARHHDLIEAVVTAHQGTIFETVGDAVYAAFARPRDAAGAAVAAHRALGAEDWSPIPRLAVRIALHTGAVERRGDHYFGPVLFRASRLQALCHGEQTLLSGATARLLTGTLPNQVVLRDLGMHRLKDLGEPEHVFQLDHPDLRSEFPALRSLDAHPHNLPVQLSSFIGRERELAEVGRLLVEERLVTLLGPGGIGKTRLALQVAAEHLDGFAGGTYFVDLAPVGDPQLVLATIAEALGVREEGSQPIADVLERHLLDRPTLLVLDNLEQLLPRAAPTVAALLAAAPEARVVATSRTPLRVRGEREYRVSGLAAGSADSLDSEPPAAIELFLERARSVGLELEITPATGPIVAAICGRLDGLPLAIELAAARLRIFTLKDLHDRLVSVLSLGSGATDVPERQRTLRSTITWTEQLLSPEERRALARLSVFAGGFTLEAAEAVAREDGSGEFVDTVMALVEQSLLRRVDDEGSTARYAMLEMVREYAAERLDESAEAHTARGRLAGHMVALAAEMEPLLVGAGQGEAYRRLDIELPNLRLALGWLREQRDPAFPLLAAALARYWTHRGLLSEGRRWVAEARASVPDAPPAVAARLLHADGLLADQQGILAESVELLREAATLYRELGDNAGLTRVLVSLSNAQQALGNLDAAAETAGEAARLAHTLGDVRSEASATGNLAIVALKQGRLDHAQEGIARAIEMFRRAGDLLAVVIGLGNLGALAASERDFARAAELHNEALGTAISLHDPGLEAWSRVNLSGAVYRRGDWADAAPMAANGIARLLEVEDIVAVVNGLGLAGSILAAGGDPRSAIVAWSAAETNAERLGIPLDRDDHDETVIKEGRAAVDPAKREAATREGAELDISEGVAFVVDRLALLAPPQNAATASPHHD